MKKCYLLYFVCGLLLMGKTLRAQQNMTLYNMELLAARSSMNPALMNHGKVNILLPVISNSYLSYSNSAFKYSDLVRRSSDDSLYIDMGNMLGKLKSSNYMTLAAETDLLSIGFRVKKSYIGVNATEKIQVRFSYPKELLEFITKGNGAMLGQEADLSFGMDMIHYREYGLTFAHNMNKNLTIGAKVKYLYGMENLHTGKSSLSLYTDPETFAITTRSNIHINTAGIDKGKNHEKFDIMKYAFNKQNSGYGIDLGFNYRLSQKFTVNGSVIDIGYINWKTETSSYASTRPDAEFTYSGIDINSYSNDSMSYEDALQDVLDTLSSSLHVDTVHSSYQTTLPVQVYAGGTYLLNEKNNVGLLLYGQFYNKKIHPAATISFNKLIWKGLNLAVSYTIVNNTYNNLGFGFALNDYDVQLFAVTDNVLGVIFPQRAKNVSLRAGITIKIGNKK